MKAIVIGAGVLGASVTYQLAKRGVDVTIIDKGIPGEAASAASFAWLNSNTKEERSYHDLNVISMAEWNVVARELRSSSWLDINGNLDVAGTDADAQELLQRVARLESYGYAAIPLSPGELQRIDPVIRIRNEYKVAAFFPSEGQITVPLLIHDLLTAATAYGATVRHSTKVAELLADGDTVKGVVLEGGERLESDVVVVAAGAGIGGILDSQGIDVSTEGEPGVTVTTSPGASKLTTILHLPGLSVRPDTSGRILVRSSAIDDQIDLDTWTVPDSAIRTLFEQAGAGILDVDPAALKAERVQIAHRPYPFDGLPVVGFWDGKPGLYVTTMHSGVTLGAVTGRLAAEEITGGKAPKLLEDFRPSRVIGSDTNQTPTFDPHALEAERIVAH
ncbi:NAD(P)/FAD-dependent oxidoreductase [Arthrobacter ramosus]|uniref:NAD(P)/FAD-dependent oxidoreductase n=1 Tax=Arthrobacter ramosus TaxID=1672 RepID=A0ABV5XWP3_ARTRM|nr:FAD-dependent oxidoreductase [Arthrobacter ramosus]